MRPLTAFTSSILASVLIFSGCNSASERQNTKIEIVQKESQRLNDWFEARYQDELLRSPMTQTYFGMKDSQDRLDDSSQLAADEDAALVKSWLDEMRSSFDVDRLDAQTKLSYRLFEQQAEDQLDSHAFSDQDYVFQHMSGPHSNLPSFMINFHAVDSKEDAEAYIARLRSFPEYLGHYDDRAHAQYENGVSLPAFVYPKIIQASQNVISGTPFAEDETAEDSPLYADIKSKIDKLDIPVDEKDALKADAKAALIEAVQPAYKNLITRFEEHKKDASDDDGAWKLPEGETFYQSRLKHYTTTDMTADEIHEIGVKEVARIQDEMREIMTQVGFEGTLQDFFEHLRTDEQFTYSNDAEGHEKYISRATAIIDEMKGRLDDLFITKPKADMIVKRVEPFREDTAFGAFYNQPALDGSRPGTYYINLKDMGELPIYQMQALAYHEGIPGHHMQIAIGMELEDLPKFRTLGGHTPYIEGWALYSESLGKEMGLYTDPYQDFGRLSMEIFRAARLVVDTGIHSKKWTRDEAVKYFLENTANSEGDIRAEIDRYIVWPGQATAYKIGMLKIIELRADAEDQLGDKFDIREFHDIILANGSVPLSILENLVNDWIKTKSQEE